MSKYNIEFAKIIVSYKQSTAFKEFRIKEALKHKQWIKNNDDEIEIVTMETSYIVNVLNLLINHKWAFRNEYIDLFLKELAKRKEHKLVTKYFLLE